MVLIHNFSTVESKIHCTSLILIATLGHVTAVILFIPEATASWPVIAKQPISLVFATCVHPQSSIEIFSEFNFQFSTFNFQLPPS